MGHNRTKVPYQHPLRLRFLGWGAPAFFGRGIVEDSPGMNHYVEAFRSVVTSSLVLGRPNVRSLGKSDHPF